MTLTEMREILNSGEIQLTKSLGQNFLHDIGQLRKIAAQGELTPTDNVLEIGPGLGPLTELLLERAGKVLAIEKDWRLFEFLRERHKSVSNLELVQADALDYIRAGVRDWTNWKLVANLPYSVASPILVELAQAPKPPERLVATLQLEVAERILSQANSSEYGVLTLLLQLRYAPRGSFKISSSSFFPAPNVDSACVTLIRRPAEFLPPEAVPVFAKIVKRAFSQRRKMMLKLLKMDWPPDALAEAFESTGISVQARGEACSLEQFVALTKHVSNNE
jgi:16S rRNA (adenine1518-N6/adenine1519-N6)-dimethyltransferase